MKALLITLFVSFISSMAACGQSPTVEKRLEELERRVTVLEKASPLSLFTAPSASPAVETKSPLELVSFDYRLARGEFSQFHYSITLVLKNNADKDIKLIDASVQFSDLLGERIYSIKVGPDRLIQAGKLVTDKGEYSVNQFISEQARMSQMKKEDVKATLVVRKLVFADNSVGEYSP